MGTRQAVRALRVVSVALVAAGVISVVTVGGTTKQAGAQQVATVTAAPDSVAAAGTVTIKFHFSGSGGGQNLAFDGVEHQDFANRRSTGQISLPDPYGDLNLVTDGNTLYFQTNATSGANGEPGWWQINVADGLVPVGSGQSMTPVPNGTDYLAYLREVAGDVTDEGDTTIDGVAVHHYRAALDLSKILALAGADLDAQQAQLAQLEQRGIELDASTDAFIDDNGLPHRVSMKFSAEGFSFEMTMDFVDYGAPVEVVVPPAEQVVETRTVESKADLLALGQELGQLLVAGG